MNLRAGFFEKINNIKRSLTQLTRDNPNYESQRSHQAPKKFKL